MELNHLNLLVIDWIIPYEYLKQFCHKNERPSHTKKCASMELKHLNRLVIDWIISYEHLKQFCHKNERPSHTKNALAWN